jgi:hypothetical protein
MARTGHDSSRAALIYQHATAEADRETAKAVSAQFEAEHKKARAAAKEACPEAGYEAVSRRRRRSRRCARSCPMNGPQMAQGVVNAVPGNRRPGRDHAFDLGFNVERVRGIEPPLSAWETYRRPWSRWSATWPSRPTLTSADRSSTVLMAR